MVLSSEMYYKISMVKSLSLSLRGESVIYPTRAADEQSGEDILSDSSKNLV